MDSEKSVSVGLKHVKKNESSDSEYFHKAESGASEQVQGADVRILTKMRTVDFSKKLRLGQTGQSRQLDRFLGSDDIEERD